MGIGDYVGMFQDRKYYVIQPSIVLNAGEGRDSY